MNAAQLSVVPILATPFGVLPLPGSATLNPLLAGLFAARIRAGDTAPGSHSLCHRGRDDLLAWPDPPVRQLAAAMFAGVYSVIHAVNDFSGDTLRSLRLESRAWFTVIEQDGGVPASNHPLTAWCAVYCVAAPLSSAGQDSGVLRLYESRLSTSFQDATTAAMRLPYLPGHYGWRPVPGQMAVFPASVTHEIALLREPGPLVLVTARVRFVAPGQVGMGRW